MTERCLVLLLILELMAVGCHQGPYAHAQLELLNAEKRALEDQFYSLEFDYEDAMRQIDKLKVQNDRLRGSTDVPSGESLSEPRRRSSSGRSSTSPKTEFAPPMIEEGTLTEPKIELGPSTPAPEPRRPESPSPKPSATPRTQSPSAPTPPSVPYRSSGKPSGENPPAEKEIPTRILTLEPADPRVTHVFVNPILTGGVDFDHQPGDDGVVVVLEPRNRDDTFVPLAGPISVLVLDPDKSAEQGRILARWEIDAAEAQRLMVNSPTVRGIQLRLPWPASPPLVSRLQLHVRYVTVDHRDLRAERELFITLPGVYSQRWTPRATPRQTPDSPAGPPTIRSSPPLIGSKPPSVTEFTSRPNHSAPTKIELPSATKSTAETPSSVLPTPTARPEWRPVR